MVCYHDSLWKIRPHIGINEKKNVSFPSLFISTLGHLLSPPTVSEALVWNTRCWGIYSQFYLVVASNDWFLLYY